MKQTRWAARLAVVVLAGTLLTACSDENKGSAPEVQGSSTPAAIEHANR